MASAVTDTKGKVLWIQVAAPSRGVMVTPSRVKELDAVAPKGKFLLRYELPEFLFCLLASSPGRPLHATMDVRKAFSEPLEAHEDRRGTSEEEERKGQPESLEWREG